MFTAKHFQHFEKVSKKIQKLKKKLKILILFKKIPKLHLSQKRLEIRRNGQNVGSHVLSMFTVQYFSTFRKF